MICEVIRQPLFLCVENLCCLQWGDLFSQSKPTQLPRIHNHKKDWIVACMHAHSFPILFFLRGFIVSCTRRMSLPSLVVENWSMGRCRFFTQKKTECLLWIARKSNGIYGITTKEESVSGSLMCRGFSTRCISKTLNHGKILTSLFSCIIKKTIGRDK